MNRSMASSETSSSTARSLTHSRRLRWCLRCGARSSTHADRTARSATARRRRRPLCQPSNYPDRRCLRKLRLEPQPGPSRSGRSAQYGVVLLPNYPAQEKLARAEWVYGAFVHRGLRGRSGPKICVRYRARRYDITNADLPTKQKGRGDAGSTRPPRPISRVIRFRSLLR